MFVVDHEEVDVPQLSKDMFVMDDCFYEYDIMRLPFTNEVNQSKDFKELQDLLVDVLHSNYYNPWDIVEPEFEVSIDKRIYFNMVLNPCSDNYYFTVSMFADNDEVMADVEIELTDEEKKMCMEIAQEHELIAC
jgi:hypothetical protein